ncbi:MAG: type II secretion system F family protein [Epsilonproteobacteria bacterium]|nr:type II secretion system F family protein [Campylobacterota bacterium]
MKYKYTAYDKQAKKIKGTIEANSIKEAKAQLKDLIILDIKPIKSFNFSLSSSVSKKELAKLFNVLGLYLKASIPILTAINLTKNQTDSYKLIRFLDKIQTDIKEGKTFFDAVNSQNIIKIPKYVISSIKVGEESGKLDIVLREMAKFLKDEDKLASKTTQALIYPMFIVMVAVFLVSFMLTTVVPKIVKVFDNLNQELPKITKIVIALADFLKHNYLSIITIFIVTVIILVLAYKKSKKFRYFIHSLALKTPLLKKIVISKELGRFSYLTYVLTSSGVNYITAINLASNTIENEKIKDVFEKAINDVIEGKKLSVSLVKAGFDFDKSFIQAIALAEETSDVAEILKNISEIYFEENESRINILLSMLEPMLIIIIGGAIGFIVTALLLPMFSMNMLKG